jgi:hypothetical protein
MNLIVFLTMTLGGSYLWHDVLLKGVSDKNKAIAYIMIWLWGIYIGIQIGKDL